MKKCVSVGVVIVLAVAFAPASRPVSAQQKLDGSVPILCAAMEVLECDAGGECQRRGAEAANLPPFLKIDFKAKTIATVDGSRNAPIHNVERVDGQVVLHGGQEGRGWSAVITSATGKLSASVVVAGGAFVIFGACTAP
ncbi:MAG: hypothetical protein ACRELS_13750 [Candidatus Rokuibacteriota bacterium]